MKKGTAIVVPFLFKLKIPKRPPQSCFQRDEAKGIIFLQFFNLFHSKKLPLRPFKENSFKLSAMSYQLQSKLKADSSLLTAQFY
jgi:hypothetical protein